MDASRERFTLIPNIVVVDETQDNRLKLPEIRPRVTSGFWQSELDRQDKKLN